MERVQLSSDDRTIFKPECSQLPSVLFWEDHNAGQATYEDGYLRIRLRGGSMKSKLRQITHKRPRDLKTWILTLQKYIFMNFLPDLKKMIFGVRRSFQSWGRARKSWILLDFPLVLLTLMKLQWGSRCPQLWDDLLTFRVKIFQKIQKFLANPSMNDKNPGF